MLKHQDAAHTATGSNTGTPSPDYTTQARHACASEFACSSSPLCQHLHASRPAEQQGKAPQPQPRTKRLRAYGSRAEQCLQSKALILQHRAWDASLTLTKGASILLNKSVCTGMTARQSEAVPKQRCERQQSAAGAVLTGQGKPRQISVLALNSLFMLASATPPLWGESARAQALKAAITSSEHGSRQKACPA